MYYCDVVRGTKALVGPFSGKSKLDSVYEANTQETVSYTHLMRSTAERMEASQLKQVEVMPVV